MSKTTYAGGNFIHRSLVLDGGTNNAYCLLAAKGKADGISLLHQMSEVKENSTDRSELPKRLAKKKEILTKHLQKNR